MPSPSPGDCMPYVACSISISLFICTLRLHEASYINIGKHFNVVLNYMYFFGLLVHLMVLMFGTYNWTKHNLIPM